MNESRLQRWSAIVDVALLPVFIVSYIWRLQFAARWTWIFFIVWLGASFWIHRDTPKTLGWRADNLWRATKQALVVFGAMTAGLAITGFVLGASRHLPPNLISWNRLWTYFAFCMLQQVALNSLVHNRMLSLIQNEWTAAVLTGIVFAACHWPNPVLVPLTFMGGAAMAWMFGRVRNIILLAIGQAILGSLIWWAFPLAWHHHLRVGPGYYHDVARNERGPRMLRLPGPKEVVSLRPSAILIGWSDADCIDVTLLLKSHSVHYSSGESGP